MSQLIAYELMTVGTASPRIGVDGRRMPSRYLTIDGVAAYQIGYSCGTCGLVLRRQPGAPSGTLSATACEIVSTRTGRARHGSHRRFRGTAAAR